MFIDVVVGFSRDVLEAAKQNDKIALEDLKEKIEKRKDTVNSEWLIEKIGN